MKELSLSVQISRNERKDGTRQIQIRVYYGSPPVYIKTGYTCKPSQWDDRRKRIKNDKAATNVIHALLARVRTTYDDMVLEGLPISSKAIKKRVEGGPDTDFVAWCDKIISEDVRLSYSSKKQHKILTNKISEFAGGMVPFNHITYTWVKQFETWMSNQKTERGYLPKQSYVATILSLLRRNVKEAYRQGKIRQNPFDVFQIKKGTKKKRVWCTHEEVHDIAQVDTRGWKGKLTATKNMWLLQYYTGVRYSDVKRIRCNHFHMDDQAQLWFKITPWKTRKSGTVVEFNISDLYHGEAEKFILQFFRYRSSSDKLLPDLVQDAKVYNANLKRLAEAAGIEKHITSHVARHSCAMSLLNKGYSIEQVSGILGHTNIATTQEYAKMTPKNLTKRLNRY